MIFVQQNRKYGGGERRGYTMTDFIEAVYYILTHSTTQGMNVKKNNFYDSF